jgi:hypothetical protein
MRMPASEAGKRASNFLDSFVEDMRKQLHFSGLCVEDGSEGAAQFAMFLPPQLNRQSALVTSKQQR